MSEHKTVIIDLEETEKSEIGELSDLESTEAKGVLSVINVSERSRIWNVKVLLGESRDGTSISEDTLSAGEINADNKWTSKYKIEIDAPILTLTEVFDTCYTVETEEPHWAYVYGKENPVRITLKVKNETEGQLDNIILNKTIPSELSNIQIESTTSGTAEFDEGTRQVVWKDFIIYPNEDSMLSIAATGLVEDIDPKNAGEVVVSYRGEDQQRSSLDPDMTALTEFLTGIETAETEPNQWECTLECSNESDLMVRLEKVVVDLTPEEGGDKEMKIDESPGKEMTPSEEWTASFNVASKSTPKCTFDVAHTPMRIVTKRILGTIEKTPQIIPVCRIDYTKSFDPPEVSSFDKTPVEVNIEVKNVGSARLNEIRIEDNLPDDIKPPTKDFVNIWIRDEEYSGEWDLVIDPDNQNPETPHKLDFTIGNLKDTVGELEPGETVKINYAIMTWKSRPEKEYASPILCMAYTYPEGLPAEIASAEDGHKLGIIYKKRRISVKKAISKGEWAGEYIVMVVVQNKGEVTVENVNVTDWIPSGFEYRSVDPEELEPKLETVADGTNMVWTWPRMNPADKFTIRVMVQGEGEYERREPEVTSD